MKRLPYVMLIILLLISAFTLPINADARRLNAETASFLPDSLIWGYSLLVPTGDMPIYNDGICD